MTYRELSDKVKSNRGILALLRTRPDRLTPQQLTKRKAFLAEHPAIDVIYQFQQQLHTLLMELKAMSNSRYLLSGIKANTPLTENALPRAIKRIEDRIGIPSWTAHDLRRTFATQFGEALHIDPVVIEKCLGHKMPRIMATYNKNEMLPQRKEALDRWAQFVENLLQENVIPISLSKCS